MFFDLIIKQINIIGTYLKNLLCNINIFIFIKLFSNIKKT